MALKRDFVVHRYKLWSTEQMQDESDQSSGAKSRDGHENKCTPGQVEVDSDVDFGSRKLLLYVNM